MSHKTVKLNTSEYRALNRLRGLPEDAHMLIMCSRMTSTGGTLDGPQKAFDELVAFIDEEFAESLVSAADRRALESICGKIDPNSVDWLGM